MSVLSTELYQAYARGASIADLATKLRMPDEWVAARIEIGRQALEREAAVQAGLEASLGELVTKSVPAIAVRNILGGQTDIPAVKNRVIKLRLPGTPIEGRF